MQGISLEKLVLLTQKIGALEPTDRMALLLEHLLKLSAREIKRMQVFQDKNILKIKRDALHFIENDLLVQVYAFKMKARHVGNYEDNVEIRWVRQEAYDVLTHLILNIAGIDQKLLAA